MIISYPTTIFTDNYNCTCNGTCCGECGIWHSYSSMTYCYRCYKWICNSCNRCCCCHHHHHHHYNIPSRTIMGQYTPPQDWSPVDYD